MSPSCQPCNLQRLFPNILCISTLSDKKTHFNSINLNNTARSSIKAHPSNLILGSRKAYSQYMVSRTRRNKKNTRKLFALVMRTKRRLYAIRAVHAKARKASNKTNMCVYMRLVEEIEGKKEENNFQFS